MKRIIKQLLFAPISIPNKLVKRTNWYKNLFSLDKNNYPSNVWYREHEERNFDVVNVGSSSALYAFDYTEEPVKAFNWAAQPQSLEYSFRILKNYFSILRHGGTVIIPFSPFSALSVHGKWRESAYFKYIGILDHTLIDNYPQMARKVNYPILFMPKVAIKRIIKDVPLLRPQDYQVQLTSAAQFESDAKRWIDSWCKEFGIKDLDAPLSVENLAGRRERLAETQKMLDFCYERNLRPVLVMTPMHPSLACEFSKTFRENYIHSFIKELKGDNLKFMDYMDDERFTKDEYFIN